MVRGRARAVAWRVRSLKLFASLVTMVHEGPSRARRTFTARGRVAPSHGPAIRERPRRRRTTHKVVAQEIHRVGHSAGHMYSSCKPLQSRPLRETCAREFTRDRISTALSRFTALRRRFAAPELETPSTWLISVSRTPSK